MASINLVLSQVGLGFAGSVAAYRGRWDFINTTAYCWKKWATSPTKELRGYCKQIKIASMFSRWRLLWFEKSDLYFVQMFHYTFPTTKNKVAMIIINNFSIKRTFFCRKITLFEKMPRIRFPYSSGGGEWRNLFNLLLAFLTFLWDMANPPLSADG